MSILITGLNCIAIIVIWQFFLKKTILDHHRDRLFDLRHKVREHFIDKKSLEHPAYKEIRSLINNQIHMMESITLTKYMYWSRALSRNAVLKGQIDADISERFRCQDAELSQFLNAARKESSEICVSYMVCSSFWLLMASSISALVITTKMIIRDLTRHTLKSASKEASHFKRINRQSRNRMFTAKTIEEASALSSYHYA